MIGQPPKGCVDNFSLETRWPDCLDEAGGRYAPLSPSRYCRPSIGRFPMCYGIQFAHQPRNRNTTWSRQMRFDMFCDANDIEHRLTKPNHPWTNGQVDRTSTRLNSRH